MAGLKMANIAMLAWQIKGKEKRGWWWW